MGRSGRCWWELYLANRITNAFCFVVPRILSVCFAVPTLCGNTLCWCLEGCAQPVLPEEQRGLPALLPLPPSIIFSIDHLCPIPSLAPAAQLLYPVGLVNFKAHPGVEISVVAHQQHHGRLFLDTNTTAKSNSYCRVAVLFWQSSQSENVVVLR